MLVSRVFSRVSKNLLNHCRGLFVSPRQEHLPFRPNNFQSLLESSNPWVPSQVSILRHSVLNPSATQGFGFSSSATQSTEKESNQSESEHGTTVERKGSSTNDEFTKTSEDVNAQEQTEEIDSCSESKTSTSQTGKRRRGTKRTAFSDSDSEVELSIDDLIKLVAEKEELLKIKHKKVEKMQKKVLQSYSEMEKVMDRTRRAAENAKKYAIQNFAKSLLDVADNLERASSVFRERLSNIDESKDTTGAVSLLKTLLEGVEMTEKQLLEVFAKFGVKKFDPITEQFDPHRHNAVFQIPDGSKPPGTVVVVLKPGYMLHDRVIRPADVGVTKAVDNNDANRDSGA